MQCGSCGGFPSILFLEATVVLTVLVHSVLFCFVQCFVLFDSVVPDSVGSSSGDGKEHGGSHC